MPKYENIFIVRQDASVAQVEAMTEGFAKIITENGGSIANTETWGLKTLAYRIKKNRKGHFVMFNIDAPAPAVAEMERNMRINEDLLRFMTIRVEAFEEGPSVMMRPREERGEFGDRMDGDRPERSEGFSPSGRRNTTRRRPKDGEGEGEES
ncbi:MAG TPA: 30S ribosomal protein S6 [Rhodospirillaceae bacterium]|nr:MAG: 30S ribosomal protein S6 [Alphaproteobacteria bacterium GWF2_58_20]HAU28927.1 30S ribosomal protein S6 [Rhodospirillaceae bacterium]